MMGNFGLSAKILISRAAPPVHVTENTVLANQILSIHPFHHSIRTILGLGFRVRISRSSMNVEKALREGATNSTS